MRNLSMKSLKGLYEQKVPQIPSCRGCNIKSCDLYSSVRKIKTLDRPKKVGVRIQVNWFKYKCHEFFQKEQYWWFRCTLGSNYNGMFHGCTDLVCHILHNIWWYLCGAFPVIFVLLFPVGPSIRTLGILRSHFQSLPTTFNAGLVPYWVKRDLALIQWPPFLVASKDFYCCGYGQRLSWGMDCENELKKRIEGDGYISCAVREYYASLKSIIKIMAQGDNEKKVLECLFKEVEKHIEGGDLIAEYRLSALPCQISVTAWKKV